MNTCRHSYIYTYSCAARGAPPINDGGMHQTFHISWGFKDPGVPEFVRSKLNALVAANPGWTVRVWGPRESRRLIVEHFPWFLPIYDAYPYWVQRSDASRYAVLHTYGGVYLDVDYTLRAPMARILEDLRVRNGDAVVWLNETPNKIARYPVSNSFMLATEPGHPFWDACMHRMQMVHTKEFVSASMQVLATTGPMMVSDVLRSRSWGGSVGMMPAEVYNPCSSCSTGRDGCDTAPHVLACHNNSGSWNGASARDPYAVAAAAKCAWVPILIVALGLLCVVAAAVIVPRAMKQHPGVFIPRASPATVST
jgi:hypothetical protein